ncbi:hypothetical protein BDZ89DRAFT_1062167 [Hymenopellis radicata]|nr:hypothetical protein BDZ89DRAFT_1062167 [Hymenopellis radicata]
MQKITSQCTNCGAFTRQSLHHEEEYQTSVLLERLRTTNFPPTDEEISHVRQTILPTVSDDISSIESKLASLREVITSMEEERERLKNVQRRYSNLISLHRALPLEILEEIFLCTHSSRHFTSNAFDASGSIWKLSHVCQKWRNIALSLRSFWSTLNICFPKAAQHETDVERLETVIQRSRERLLDVSLRQDIPSRRSPGPNPSVLKRMLDIVLAESYRWQKLELSDSARGLNVLYAPLHNRLPRLESLYLAAHIESKEQSVFKDCPCLTKVTLDGASPQVIELPWDQITELDLSAIDTHEDEEERRECMRLIGRCPSLEILSTPYWDSEDDDDTVYTRLTCSNLRKLDVTSVPVIDALTLPLLREASLRPSPPQPHYYGILSSFKQLLIRSKCFGALTGLSLTGVPLAASPEHSLHSILSQTHSLAFLDLDVPGEDFDDGIMVGTDDSDREQIVAIVESLQVTPTKTVTFLPLLSSLIIRVANHHDSLRLLYFGPVGSFASMIKARWKGDDTVGLARLRTCHFAVRAHHLTSIYRGVGGFFPPIFSEAERLVFDALVDDGMDLTIRVTSDLFQTLHEDDKVVFAVPS